MLGGSACCACGLSVQAEQGVIRGHWCIFSCCRVELPACGGDIFASAQWESQPGTVPFTRSLLPWEAAGGDCPLWTLRVAVPAAACSVAEVSAHGFSSALLGSEQSCVPASSPQPLSLQQMCFQDKNNTVNCKSPSAFLFACAQQTVCLGMACVGTHRL